MYLDTVETENTPPAPKLNSPGEPSQKSTSRKLPGPDLRQELQEAAQTHLQKTNEGHQRINLESESSGYVPYGNAECVEQYKERMYTSPTTPRNLPDIYGKVYLGKWVYPSVLPFLSPNFRLKHITNAL